jgi:vacuolar-type H+-ATPase subunit H
VLTVPHIAFASALQEVAHAEIIRALKVEQAKELTKLRQEFELQARELGSKYEKKMKMLRDDLELRRKQEIHEIEEHKVSMHTCSDSKCLQLLLQRQQHKHQNP